MNFKKNYPYNLTISLHRINFETRHYHKKKNALNYIASHKIIDLTEIS